jgi:hypothetical protein
MRSLRSLWNLLSFQRVLLLTEHGQDPFSQLSEEFKSEIERDETAATLEDAVFESNRGKNLVNLFHLLNTVYKLIISKLTLNEQSLEYVEYGIEDMLGEYVEDGVDLTGVNLESIKVKNVFHLWKMLVDLYFRIRNI